MVGITVAVGIGFMTLIILSSPVVYKYKKENSKSPVTGTIASILLISIAPIFGFVTFALMLEAKFRLIPVTGLFLSGILLVFALYTYLEEPFTSREAIQ